MNQPLRVYENSLEHHLNPRKGLVFIEVTMAWTSQQKVVLSSQAGAVVLGVQVLPLFLMPESLPGIPN